MRRLASIASALALVTACARPAGAPPRTGATAGDELEAFASFVRDVHPDPFRFVSADVFSAIVDDEASRLRAEETPGDLVVGRAFQRVAASLHDAHVAVAQPAYQPGYAGEVSFLPFVVAIVGDAVLVDAASDAVPDGTAVVTIDGEPIDAIRDAIAELAIYDGSSATARARVIAEQFVPLYHLVRGMRPSYAIVLRMPDGTLTSATWTGVSRDRIDELASTRRSDLMRGRTSGVSWPTLERIAPATCHLRLPSFGVADAADYEARLDAIVADAVSCARLFVDLRGNEGGYRTLGVALANHLVDVDYVQWRSSSVRVRAIPSEYRDAVAPLFGVSLDRLAAFPSETDGDGVHRLDGDPLAGGMHPKTPRLTASLALFVDGATNSAANEFVLAIRSVRPDAVLIGEEIGGGCEGHVGELPVAYTTPSYGVSVAMSLIRIDHVAVDGCTSGRGLVPDVPVAYSGGDFVTGNDPYVVVASSLFP